MEVQSTGPSLGRARSATRQRPVLNLDSSGGIDGLRRFHQATAPNLTKPSRLTGSDLVRTLTASPVTLGTGAVARAAAETLAAALAFALALPITVLLALALPRTIPIVRTVLARTIALALAFAGTLFSRDGER